ncbi:MAG: ATP-dependent DNA ligase [Acidobacteria bacterium]|nr:ATP-dependent DNA ligase [Acidobacteriota bacterium]
MPRTKKATPDTSGRPVQQGAVPAEELKQPFPPINLPIRPPFAPMEAKSVESIPAGDGWSYEPKWDGFRCLAFRKGDEVLLQSKSGQPLGRYFPELVEALAKLTHSRFVVDGEIVIVHDGHLSFDDLLLRIHPAASRIRKLSVETPATLLLFDILLDDVDVLTEFPLVDRREKLKQWFKGLGRHPRIRLSPSTTSQDEAERWIRELGASGFDGVVAKRLDAAYLSGERAMQKIKRIRTADCVIGGFRYAQKGGQIGSLLLGLYNQEGLLDHVGFTSSFNREDRKALKPVILPLSGGEGFTGHAPGGPSRWSTRRSDDWVPLKPKLVCEVQYDHFSGRFRHGTKFLRWRPDKAPKQCTFEQVLPSHSRGGLKQFGLEAA